LNVINSNGLLDTINLIVRIYFEDR